MDVGRDHLIHRKRSPFPYEGKALTLDKVGKISPIESNSSLLTPNYCPIFPPHSQVLKSLSTPILL